MVKAIIFDIGGVLDKGKPEEHWVELCKSLNLDFEKFQAIRKKYTDDARIGKLSTKEYVSQIAKDLGLKYEDLFSNWLRTKRENMKIDKEIENLIKNLKKKGYKVATLSNIIELHHQVRIENKAYDLFDFAVISFKERIDKPNEKIYQIVIDKLKLPPEEMVFIEDSERNLKTAKKLGMKTILFKDNKQLIKDLKDLGVKI